MSKEDNKIKNIINRKVISGASRMAAEKSAKAQLGQRELSKSAKRATGNIIKRQLQKSIAKQMKEEVPKQIEKQLKNIKIPVYIPTEEDQGEEQAAQGQTTPRITPKPISSQQPSNKTTPRQTHSNRHRRGGKKKMPTNRVQDNGQPVNYPSVNQQSTTPAEKGLSLAWKFGLIGGPIGGGVVWSLLA